MLLAKPDLLQHVFASKYSSNNNTCGWVGTMCLIACSWMIEGVTSWIHARSASMTGCMWKKLHEDTTASAKIAVVVHRLWKVGLTCPSEATIKYMVAVVAAAHCPDAEAGTLPSMVLEMNSVVENTFLQQGFALQHLKVFPEDPKDLPEPLYKNAYDHENPVVAKLDRFQEVFLRVPLRNTNKAIGGAPALQAGMQSSPVEFISHSALSSILEVAASEALPEQASGRTIRRAIDDIAHVHTPHGH